MNPQVIFQGHPSWRSELMIGHLGRGWALVLVTNLLLYGALRMEKLSTAVAVGGMIAIALAVTAMLYLIRSLAVYRVTNTLVYKKTGLLKISKREYNLRNVVSVSVDQGRFERWITRTGDVIVATPADNEDIVLEGVSNPDRIAERIRSAQNELYNQGSFTPPWSGGGGGSPGGFAPGAYPPVAPPAGPPTAPPWSAGGPGSPLPPR